MTATADVVVVGAGIAGVAAAYDLAVNRGMERVVIVDPRPPLTLTSDKSTECYRNFWPTRSMVHLMNRSIDLFEEMAKDSGNVFGLNRRGYLFVTGDQSRLAELETSARISSGHGSGPVRLHPRTGTFGDMPDGFDILESAALNVEFPFLTNKAAGALYVQRAGWLSAQQLGSWMLDMVRRRGGALLADEVVGVTLSDDRVIGVELEEGGRIATPTVVDAAGPMAAGVAAMAGLDLPLFSEVHLKVAVKDHLGVIPRDAPMFIWSDPQVIDWDADQKRALIELGRPELVAEMPIFCHGRPEGGSDSPYVLALWEYHDDVREPRWPLPEDPLYPEVVLRGLTTMVPGMSVYLDRLPESVVDGGYYTKTAENRPLIGPAGPEGFHVICALSGFGVMVSAGAADLLGAHVTGGPLPDYADDFLLSRYQDESYIESLALGADSGQL